jgi:hypothetical protein
VTRLGHQVRDLQQPRRQLALVIPHPRAVLDDPRHRRSVEMPQLVVVNLPADEGREAPDVFVAPVHLRREVGAHRKELGEVFVQ